MVRPIVKDVFFLAQKSEPATQKDLQIGRDLQDTLNANSAFCVGMAANMIGELKNIIIVHTDFGDLLMFNPTILQKEGLYEAKEGCLSLTGERKALRYEHIQVEYRDAAWKKRTIQLSGFPAQICQHEMDHLQGTVI